MNNWTSGSFWLFYLPRTPHSLTHHEGLQSNNKNNDGMNTKASHNCNRKFTTTTMALSCICNRNRPEERLQIELNKSKLSLKNFRIREIIMTTQSSTSCLYLGCRKEILSCSLFGGNLKMETYSYNIHLLSCRSLVNVCIMINDGFSTHWRDPFGLDNKMRNPFENVNRIINCWQWNSITITEFFLEKWNMRLFRH